MQPARLLRKRVIICLGTGGVGKTTVAAALGVAAARQGRRTAVITVDPARRLKDALGLRHLSADPHGVPLDNAPGYLDAFALDAKRTFDALVERFTPSTAAAERILTNRLYQEISTGLAGSAEYMAMEKLHQLVTPGEYQTVIVDTPPSAHARDLLTAPGRLADLLASRAIRLLKSPASLLSRATALSRVTLGPLLRALERWTGLDLLADLAEFTSAIEHLGPGFRERADQVERLLRSPSTAFVLVTTPEPHAVESTIAFQRELAAAQFRVAGVVANRLVMFPELDGDAVGLDLPASLRRRLLTNYEDLRHLSRRHARALQRLGEATGAPLVAAIPQLVELPVTVPQLERIAAYMGSETEMGPAPPARRAG